MTLFERCHLRLAFGRNPCGEIAVLTQRCQLFLSSRRELFELRALAR